MAYSASHVCVDPERLPCDGDRRATFKPGTHDTLSSCFDKGAHILIKDVRLKVRFDMENAFYIVVCLLIMVVCALGWYFDD